jgi:hypothetical protein
MNQVNAAFFEGQFERHSCWLCNMDLFLDRTECAIL